MPRRYQVLATNETYHVFNRSIGRESSFSSKRNLSKTLEIVDFYRFPQAIRLSKLKTLPVELKQSYLSDMKRRAPLVEIYSFAFMPNHYHFLLKQLTEGGIRRFISNFQNSFAKYYNLRNDRDGGLFQNSFKAKRIETEDQLVHVSRYIHLNPVTAYLIEFQELKTYPWTSFSRYMGSGQVDKIVNGELLLEIFGSKEKYEAFVQDQVDYQRELALIKDLIIE